MPVRFNPTGILDISSDPADLPSQSDGKMEVSGSMTRCTNLHLDRGGKAITRRGSAKINATAIKTQIHRIIEQLGNRYAFAGTQIYKNETSIATGMTDAQWSALLYNAYNTTTQAVFGLNGTDRKRIEGDTVSEWGSDSPTVAPVLGTGELTGLTGAYNAKYTWARKEGDVVVWESNPSPAADDSVTLSDGSLTVNCSLPTDTQITHIRVYRTLTSGSVYYFDVEIAVNAIDNTEYDIAYIYDWELDELTDDDLYYAFSQTGPSIIYTHSWENDDDYAGDDNAVKFTQPWENTEMGATVVCYQGDTLLGTEASWTNHDRPPLGTVVLGPAYSGYIFIIKDNLLYYCLPNQPEYFPADYYIEITAQQAPIKAGAFINGQLFIASGSEIYSIQGTGPGTFFPLPMSAQTGAVNSDCFIAVLGYGIFHLGNDGIYQYAGGKDELITRGQFEPIFWGETSGSIPGLNRTYITNCWMITSHGKLYFAYPGNTSQYPDNFLVMDLASKRIVHHSYSSLMKTAAFDLTNNRLLTGDTDGYIWEIEKSDLTDDDGTAIAWQLQSKNYNQYYKYFPRYAKYDVSVISGTAYGYVLLNDTVKQTHTITGDRNTRKRLVTGCTGDRLAVRLSGSGRVQIYGAEIE